MTNSPHLGIYADGLGTRIAIVMRQLPKEPTNALVIKIDNMKKNVDRDELLALLSDPISARYNGLTEMLHSRGLLQHFSDFGYIEKMSIDDILMTPGDGKRYPLRDIINQINEKQGRQQVPTDRQLDAISSADPQASQKKENMLGTDANKNIARGLLMQAQMLQADANKKFQEAYSIDPSLRPSGDYRNQEVTHLESFTIKPEKAKKKTRQEVLQEKLAQKKTSLK